MLRVAGWYSTSGWWVKSDGTAILIPKDYEHIDLVAEHPELFQLPPTANFSDNYQELAQSHIKARYSPPYNLFLQLPNKSPHWLHTAQIFALKIVPENQRESLVVEFMIYEDQETLTKAPFDKFIHADSTDELLRRRRRLAFGSKAWFIGEDGHEIPLPTGQGETHYGYFSRNGPLFGHGGTRDEFLYDNEESPSSIFRSRFAKVRTLGPRVFVDVPTRTTAWLHLAQKSLLKNGTTFQTVEVYDEATQNLNLVPYADFLQARSFHHLDRLSGVGNEARIGATRRTGGLLRGWFVNLEGRVLNLPQGIEHIEFVEKFPDRFDFDPEVFLHWTTVRWTGELLFFSVPPGHATKWFDIIQKFARTVDVPFNVVECEVATLGSTIHTYWDFKAGFLQAGKFSAMQKGFRTGAR